MKEFEWIRQFSNFMQFNPINKEFIAIGAGNLPFQIPLSHYQKTLRFTLVDVLKDKFSKTMRLVPKISWNEFFGEFTNLYPSCEYSLDRYGHELPAFLIERFPEWPWLSELARLELMVEEFPLEVPLPLPLPNPVDLQKPLITQGLQLFQSDYDLFPIWKNEKSEDNSDLTPVKKSTNILLYYKSQTTHLFPLEDWMARLLKDISSDPGRVVLEQWFEENSPECSEDIVSRFFSLLGQNSLIANESPKTSFH